MTSKSPMRSSYNSNISKLKDINQNALYLSEFNFITIYHAQLYNQYLLLCTKKYIRIYNIDQLRKQQEINIKTHFACFVPFTNLIIYPQPRDDLKNILVFWNYKSNTLHAKMTFNFNIQTIKASRRCILLSSLDHLYVIHFPSLKPIYQGFAGNGFNIICDISRQGLTLAHQTQKRGEVMIRNFTNIQTNRLLVDINQKSRANSISQIKKKTEDKISRKNLLPDVDDQIKPQIKIKAHHQHVTLMRLSPNGYRIVTTSTKGTVIRMYSCLNGELISQFRMGYDLIPVVDIQFSTEGSQIICLNQSNQINLFHARMSEQQLLSQSSRKGYQIYEQKNPISFFSFLGFINQGLKNQHPFSYFKLDTKSIEIKQQKQKLQIQLQKKQKQKTKFITEIKQVHESHLEGQNQDQHNKTVVINNEQKRQINDQVNNESVSGQIKIVQLQQSQEMPKYRKISLQKKVSASGNSKFDIIKSKNATIRSKQSSIKSAGRLTKKATQIIKFGEKEISMHFRGIINFGDITNIKILQSKYFFQLKYDPFNGGQMVQKISFNILKHPLFSDLQ